MKFFTALTLGLITLNAFALPVLSQNENEFGPVVFKDHLNPQVIYFMPDEGGMLQDVAFEGDVLKASFQLRTSKDLTYIIGQNELTGKTAEVLPVTGSNYFHTMDSIFKATKVTTGPEFNDTIDFSGRLTFGGKRQLEAILQSGNAVSVLAACFEVQGVTPNLAGHYILNPKKVYRHFLRLFKIEPFKKQEIKNEVLKMIDKDIIRVEAGNSEAQMDDYLAAVTKHITERFFKREGSSTLYGFEGSILSKNVDETVSFKNRELIEKDICIDLKMNRINRN